MDSKVGSNTKEAPKKEAPKNPAPAKAAPKGAPEKARKTVGKMVVVTR